MSEWKDRLVDVDDDYLIGISNKGIVKRAYKDREETAAEIAGVTDDEAVVNVGGETVTVRFPLGESKCSCPSRSICRHVVQGILALKERCLQDTEDATKSDASSSSAETAQTHGQKENDGPQQGMPQSQSEIPQEIGADMSRSQSKAVAEDMAGCKDMPQEKKDASGQGMPQEGMDPSGLEMPQEQKTLSEHRTPENSADTSHKTAVVQEIREYPFDKLKRAMGSRHFQSFANQAAADIRPQIRYASVITVQLPEPGFVVKLLSPLAYSTCTCHKKELCRHKAAAILWCQLEAGIVTKESLSSEAETAPTYDMDEVKEAAGQMREFLEELFGTGLSRVSPDVLDYLERLAIISHNAGLARFEGYFRALSDSYDRYLKRKAAFRTEELMGQMTRLYRRVELLQEADSNGQVAKLAGEFKADYLPVGNLDLIGIAMEHFQSQTGYEGETIYFLEENTKKWYTYTNARPVFYDSRKRRGYVEKSQAPWGIPLSLENLLKVRIHLTGAKCGGHNRLSSSQETKGEITGEQRLTVADMGNWYCRNFDKLFTEQIGRQQKNWLAEQESSGAEPEQGEQNPGQENSSADSSGQHDSGQYGTELVCVRPDSCAKAEFSQTGQQLTLPLYDKAGRELLVEVTYSKEESGTIRYLERISEKKLPCFLGKVYLRDGRMRMYPVDVLDLEEDFTVYEEPADGKDMIAGTSSEETLGEAPLDTGASDMENPEESALGTLDKMAQETLQDIVSTGRKSKYEAMEDIMGEVLSLLEDLYQSGFDTVHDSTWRDIRKAAELTEQYGMKYLAELLSGLAEEIATGRHRMEKKTTPMAKLYARLNEYLYLCRQKTAYDRGKDYYTQ